MTELWQAACWWNTALPRQLMWKWAQEDPAAQEAGEPRERPGERGDIGVAAAVAASPKAPPRSSNGTASLRPRGGVGPSSLTRAHRASYQLFGKERAQSLDSCPALELKLGHSRSDGHRLCWVGTSPTRSQGPGPGQPPTLPQVCLRLRQCWSVWDSVTEARGFHCVSVS